MRKSNFQNFLISKSSLVRNSAFGIISNIVQNLFVVVFFAIIARKYNDIEFAQFLISTTAYQLLAAFSSMGLGLWFIREYTITHDKTELTGQFLKTQIGLGLLFYILNIIFSFLLYSDENIRLLCIILGTNIIFDNFINAIRSLNIAEQRQKKTAIILIIDGFLKLLVGCLLFISPFSTIILAILLIVVRILTVGLFIKIGSSNSINIRRLRDAQLSSGNLKKLVLSNWSFMIIGSISIIYWKIDNIIISKTLPLKNVADYEISFRIFSLLLILPVIASSTVFPRFINYFKEHKFSALKKFYLAIFPFYALFGIISYVFIYSFADIIITLAFGKGYPGAIVCVREMFLTFLLFPTVLLQANLIVSMGFEKLDMWFNVGSLLLNLAGCLVGLYFFKSLSVVNYSILISFLAFHISQDIILIKKEITSIKNCILFYITLILCVWLCNYMNGHLNPYIFFVTFLVCISLLLITFKHKSFLLQIN